MTPTLSKSDSLKRRITLHENRIRKLQKRLEVIEDAEITGNILNDVKHFKNWHLDRQNPGPGYVIRCEIGRHFAYSKSTSLTAGNVTLILQVNKYGSNFIFLDSENLYDLWDFTVTYGITDITVDMFNPHKDICRLENEMKELAPLKELYDEVVRLFQTKLKQEKH